MKTSLDKRTYIGFMQPYVGKNGSHRFRQGGRKLQHPYLREGFVFDCCKHLKDKV